MPGSSELWFATSNDHKFREAKLVLKEFGLTPVRLRTKGTEIQSEDVSVIAARAASETFKKYCRPLFTEDTALTVPALRGFPGAYASYVFRTIGPAGLLELLPWSASRTAEFVSAVAFCDSDGRPRVFRGSLRGSLAAEPRGPHGFGFDPVFVPEGSDRTLAELSLAEKCAISHRAMALRSLGGWLTSRWRR